MHILYIYAEISIKGGTDKILAEKANYLVNHGYDVTIVTESQMGKPLSFKLEDKVCHIDMGLDFGKQYTQGSFRRFLTYSSLMRQYKSRLKKVVNQQRPDIIISAMGRSLSLLSKMDYDGVKIGEAHTTKAHLRSLHLMEQRGGVFKVIAKYMRWKMCRYASKLDAMVLLTPNDAEDWKSVVKTFVIPNPISFYPKESAELVNKQVIMVGRYNDAKGYDYLIPAWEILESSLCVLSSRYEGFSLVILEAMACGVPVVSFDCPYGPRNIIQNEEDGLLIDYLNYPALADGICKLIENEGLRVQFGTNARSNVLRFSQDAIMEQWEKLFRKLVNDRTNE